jgi:CubicO group peptidase (beta-lactamase class C family)
MNKKIKSLLDQGVNEGRYPGAVLLGAHKGEIVFFEATGKFSPGAGALPMHRDVIFDLASLTKPLATTLCLMKLVDTKAIELDQPLGAILTRALPADKQKITPRMLLNHCSGLPSWKPFYIDLVKFPLAERKNRVRKFIMREPLLYPPAEKRCYSDLGFMILEWVIESLTKKGMDRFTLKHCFKQIPVDSAFFKNNDLSLDFKKEMFAPTEQCLWRKRIIQGEAHDENAYALGGFSGHAGMFGSARDVYKLVKFITSHFFGDRNDFVSPNTVREFFTRQTIVTGSSWALGWDTPSPEKSSAGKHFSQNSVGHLGFTGTSVWIDLERDVVVILLTNRIHTTRANEKIRRFRPRIHNLIMEQLGTVRK